MTEILSKRCAMGLLRANWHVYLSLRFFRGPHTPWCTIKNPQVRTSLSTSSLLVVFQCRCKNYPRKRIFFNIQILAFFAHNFVKLFFFQWRHIVNFHQLWHASREHFHTKMTHPRSFWMDYLLVSFPAFLNGVVQQDVAIGVGNLQKLGAIQSEIMIS